MLSCVARCLEGGDTGEDGRRRGGRHEVREACVTGHPPGREGLGSDGTGDVEVRLARKGKRDEGRHQGDLSSTTRSVYPDLLRRARRCASRRITMRS
eukprot:2927586-Rhodomonas_salina.1